MSMDYDAESGGGGGGGGGGPEGVLPSGGKMAGLVAPSGSSGEFP